MSLQISRNRWLFHVYVFVCLEGSVVNKHELVYQNISVLFCRLELTGIEQACPQSTLYPYYFGKISERIRQERKIDNSVLGVGQEHSPVSFRSQPQKFRRVLFFSRWMPSFPMQGRYDLDEVVRAPQKTILFYSVPNLKSFGKMFSLAD